MGACFGQLSTSRCPVNAAGSMGRRNTYLESTLRTKLQKQSLSITPLPLLCLETAQQVRLTVMNTDSDIPNAVSLHDATGLACLADSENYKRLDGRRRFLLKYGHALALVPFFLAIVIGLGMLPRIVPDTAFWAGIAETLIVGSLGWSLIVILYGLSVVVRWFLIRCPRCGWRFGLGERCGSCDFPRSRGNLTPI